MHNTHGAIAAKNNFHRPPDHRIAHLSVLSVVYIIHTTLPHILNLILYLNTCRYNRLCDRVLYYFSLSLSLCLILVGLSQSLNSVSQQFYLVQCLSNIVLNTLDKHPDYLNRTPYPLPTQLKNQRRTLLSYLHCLSFVDIFHSAAN